MNIVCLDMEGVLVPEIWIAFAEESGIPELRRTTRDEPDYDKLMTWRLGILKEHGLGLKEIQAVIAKIDPLPGAKEFLDKLPGEPMEIKMIALADKLSNMRSTMKEYEKIGDAVWEKFHQKDKNEHQWYHMSVLNILSDFSDNDLWKEYKELCETIFR